MALTTKEAFAALNDLPVIKLAIPEWGDDVFLRAFSGKEQDLMDAAIHAAVNTPGKANVRGLCAALSLCNMAGELLFAASDADRLAQRNAKALDRILEAVFAQNKARPEDREQLLKNS